MDQFKNIKVFSKQYNLRHFLIPDVTVVNRSTAVLAVTADRIARVLKTFGATQTVALNISKDFYKVWHSDLL